MNDVKEIISFLTDLSENNNKDWLHANRQRYTDAKKRQRHYVQNYVLPDDVVKDQISAKVEDGILTITMPKIEPKEKVTKAIEVS